MEDVCQYLWDGENVLGCLDFCYLSRCCFSSRRTLLQDLASGGGWEGGVGVETYKQGGQIFVARYMVASIWSQLGQAFNKGGRALSVESPLNSVEL